MFDPLPIFLVVKFRRPIAIVTVDTHPLIVYLAPNRKPSLIMRVIFVFTSRAVASLTLDASKLRRNLLTDKSLGTAKTCCMTLQTIGIILHPPEPGEGIGVRVFFPFFEVFEMAKPAFSVAYIVRLFLGMDIGSVLKR